MHMAIGGCGAPGGRDACVLAAQTAFLAAAWRAKMSALSFRGEKA
jgi:hypothetical protein